MPKPTSRSFTQAPAKWTTGDFTIITSDDDTLKIESFYLFAARYVRMPLSPLRPEPRRRPFPPAAHRSSAAYSVMQAR